MNRVLDQLLIALPKAELHLHLEGSVSRDRMGGFAAKYAAALLDAGLANPAEAVYQFKDFPGFLAAYKTVCLHLRSLEDYLLLLKDLEAYFLAENIRYAEVLFTPSIPWKFGFDGREILSALVEESARFEKESGCPIRWILDCVRQFGRESAERTAELASEFRERGVVAVGLGGDEISLPASEFEEVFAWSRAHQLYVHVHAGETGGPKEVWEALQVLGANRIGHGIQAARDPKLMEYLRLRAVGLDVCLTSNVRTRSWPLLGDHPLPLLMKRGVPISLNTDDPGLFETRLSLELRKAIQTFSLTADDLSRILIQGVRSSFLPHERKMALMQQFGDEISRRLEPWPAGRKEEGLAEQ